MASFFEIGSKIYHSNSMDTFGYTEQLEKMYRNKSTENEKTIFWFGIELVNGNDVEKKLMSFEISSFRHHSATNAQTYPDREFQLH
ncbi:hypothetical protein, partial [Dorea hominis]|uniref:hypothetical protein n=1 Tax=Dorea hominis TaxID=2763040 RepID=UPI001A9BA32C